MFYLVPILGLLAWAFGLGANGSPLSTIRDLFSSPYYRSRILFTFTQAAASTIITLGLGIPLAYVFATRGFRAKRLLRAALTVPFVMPPLVLALAFQTALGRGSIGEAVFSGAPLAALGPLGSIILAHVVYNLSVVVRLVGATWERIPPSIPDAAATLGASPRRTFWSLHLPLAAPAIAAASLLTFLFCASSFGIILLLGEDHVGTLETLIFDEVASFRPHYDAATLLGLIQLLTTIVAVGLYLLVTRRTRSTYTPVRPRTLPPPAWPQRILLLATALLVLGPFAALFSAAFRFQGRWSLTPLDLLLDSSVPLGSYTAADALRNSLLFATATLLFAVLLAFATLAGVRRQPRLASLAHSLVVVPLGTSAILLGLGFLLIYDGTPFPDLRASPMRILLVHVLVAYPFATRILAPGFDAINPTLLDAARTLGARAHHLAFRIELPLLRPALIASAVFAFAVSLGEFGATLLLRRPEYTTLPVALFDAYGRPGEAFRAQAELLAVLLAVVALASFWALEHVRRQPGGDVL